MSCLTGRDEQVKLSGPDCLPSSYFTKSSRLKRPSLAYTLARRARACEHCIPHLLRFPPSSLWAYWHSSGRYYHLAFASPRCLLQCVDWLGRRGILWVPHFQLSGAHDVSARSSFKFEVVTALRLACRYKKAKRQSNILQSLLECLSPRTFTCRSVAMAFKSLASFFVLAVSVANAANFRRVSCPDGINTATNAICCNFFALRDDLQANL